MKPQGIIKTQIHPKRTNDRFYFGFTIYFYGDVQNKIPDLVRLQKDGDRVYFVNSKTMPCDKLREYKKTLVDKCKYVSRIQGIYNNDFDFGWLFDITLSCEAPLYYSDIVGAYYVCKQDVKIRS